MESLLSQGFKLSLVCALVCVAQTGGAARGSKKGGTTTRTQLEAAGKSAAEQVNIRQQAETAEQKKDSATKPKRVRGQGTITQPVPDLMLAREAALISNNFGFKFGAEAAKTMVASKKLTNQMTSAISIHYAISMLSAGLQGKSANELFAKLGITEPQAQALLHLSNTYLLHHSRIDADNSPVRRGEPQRPVIGIHNSAWHTTDKSNPFLIDANYVANLKKHYDAEVQGLDFKDTDSADLMNKWASNKTNKLIPKVIDAATLSRLMWVLMNATYLEASWNMSMYSLPKEEAPAFHLVSANGATVKTEYAAGTNPYAHAHTAQLDIVSMPFYGAGKANLAMVIAMPKSLDLFVKMLSTGELSSSKTWGEISAAISKHVQVEYEEVNLKIPKFSFATSIEMKNQGAIVKALGIDFLYDEMNAADFIPMGLSKRGNATVVGLIKQDSKIELDEKGVKAAAVTVIAGIEATSVRPQPKIIPFTVDKPFAFYIVDQQTGAVLFNGHVVDPTKN